MCLKVCLHPLHFVVKNLLQQHFNKNGGAANLSLGKILQSKSSLAINATLWKSKHRHNVVLVIAHGILLLVSKDQKKSMVESFNFKFVRSVILAHNQASIAALQMTEAAEVNFGFSHVIIDTQSMGLLLRYITDNYRHAKLEFSDSVTLNENGLIEELYFSQLYGNSSHESDGQLSGRSLN